MSWTDRPKTKLGVLFLWCIRIGAILLPATASAYVSYREAKADMEIKSSAGYEVLLGAVEKLSDIVADQTETIGYLKGRLDSIEKALDGGSGRRKSGSLPPPEPLDELPADPLPETKRKTIFKRELPRSLEGAYQMQQDKAIDF